METSQEYDFGYAIVRIHPGKRSEEERRKVLEDATKEFWKALQKAEAAKGQSFHPCNGGSSVSGSQRSHAVVSGGIQQDAG